MTRFFGAPPREGVAHTAWLQTYTGRPFDILALSADQIFLVDMAAALSKQNRFAGHTIRPYSVAEHSVWVALRVWQLCTQADIAGDRRRRYTIAALLHDGTEAYMTDIPKPWKDLGIFDGYREKEHLLSQVIALKYNCAVDDMGQRLVHQADIEILAVEVRDVMAYSERKWHKLPTPPVGYSAGHWTHDEARKGFLETAAWLGLR